MSISSTLPRRMSSEKAEAPPKRFSRVHLPWVVGVGALAAYLATLNHWLNTSNLLPVARLSGQVWQPDVHEPLYWLVTLPIGWLPTRMIPLGMNLLAAICATLTLALLARSVALLPHDRTQRQRDREHGEFALLSIPAAWLPPLLAVLICGLELSFWEEATVASSQMLNLLVFAYVIRCLLEFRVDDRPSWLTRACFAYGLGITNGWMMIGLLPGFVAALVWINGLSFFNLRFLTRLSLYGLAGMSLYLLLPIVRSLSHTLSIPFWVALKTNLSDQHIMLSTFLHHPAWDLMLLGLASLVPVCVIGLRWSSHFGDSSPLGVALATLMFHVVHGLFLVFCVWVALDPLFSPRHKWEGWPVLYFYYLGALGVGYFSGYFLLLFGARGERTRRIQGFLRVIHGGITVGVWVLLVLAPAILLYRNLPQIRITNGPLLKQYAALLGENLPTQGAVVLSDDPRRLWLLESALNAKDRGNDLMLLDSGSLKWGWYQAFLKRKYGARWPGEAPKDESMVMSTVGILQLMSRLVESNRLYYLHPSFGYYFEFFYPEAHGMVYKLVAYPTNSPLATPPSKELVSENESFWARTDEDVLKPMVRAIVPPKVGRNPSLWTALQSHARLGWQTNREAAIVASSFYSQALDFWGVQMQVQGHLAQAAAHFARALELNPDNRAAEINLEYNQELQAGTRAADFSKGVEDEFGKSRKWDEALSRNGPYDEPNFCFQLGLAFLNGQNYRQAAAQFARVKTLQPENLPAWLWLAQLCITGKMPDEALKLVDEIRARPDLTGLSQSNQVPLMIVETSAQLAKGDAAAAAAVVRSAEEKNPGDKALLAAATRIYLNYGYYSNALEVLDQRLKITPDDPDALMKKGFASLQVKAYQDAIPPLSKLLEMETNNYTARLDRAIACLRSEQWDAARRDYELLQKLYPSWYPIYYGLGEIGYRQKDTNAAIRSYELYLANAPTNTAESKAVTTRLQELKSGTP